MAKGLSASIVIAFEAGDYERVIQLTEGAIPKGAFPYRIGALVFVGRLLEADSLAARAKPSQSLADQVAANFYLGVGACRVSDYARARGFFGQNLAVLRSTPKKAEIAAPTFQGLAFYRFFFGRYQRARRYAEKAYLAAIEQHSLHGQVLALDLLGHTSTHIGEIHQGLRHLEDARKLAERLGNGGVVSALEISRRVMRSRFGLSSPTAVEELHECAKSLEPTDTYSRADLLLELARQYYLRGEASRVRATLQEACDLIYAQGNRRQGALLNLRFAHLHFIEGDFYPALNLLRTAKANLTPAIDRWLMSQLHGLELRILQAIGKIPEQIPFAAVLAKEARTLGDQVNLRMLAREGILENPLEVANGNDWLGDLVDQVRARAPDALSTLLERGLLGLLPDLLGLPTGERHLLLDVQPGAIAIIARGEVRWIPGGAKGISRKLLLVLANGALGKEELVKRVWGYAYSPLRHDSLVYAAIAKLRRQLGDFGRWIEGNEGVYWLASDVRMRLGDELIAPAAKASVPKVRSSDVPDLTFNHRQNQILRHLRTETYVGVQDCAQLFKTSRITASRDLSFLRRLGKVEAIGRGRATRYFLRTARI